MRNLLLIILLIIFQNFSYAQQTAKLNFALHKVLNDDSKQGQDIDVLVKGDLSQIKSTVESLGGTYKYGVGNIASVKMPVRNIIQLADNTSVQRIEGGSINVRPRVLNDKMVINSDVTLVHIGTPPLPQGYDGDSVVLGLIDTGIEIDHPDYQNADGTSRIAFIWDQDNAGALAPYGYGTQCTAAQIDAGSCTHKDDTQGAHGTGVVGVAASNGLAIGNYKGVAPKSTIVAVALPYTSFWPFTAIADAVDYIFKKADGLNMPCAINISVGGYGGSHDGKDLVAEMIDSFITFNTGRVVVAAAGNAGLIPFHLGTKVTSDTSFTWFKYSPFTSTCNLSGSGVCFELWADTGDFNNVQYAFGADDPATYNFRGNTNFVDIQTQFVNIQTQIDTIFDTLFNGPNRIGIVRTIAQQVGGSYNMEVYVVPDSTTYYWRFITTGTGKFDVWSSRSLIGSSDMPYDTPTGLPVDTNGNPDTVTYPFLVNYVVPDINQTIVSSFQCSDKVITVGGYINRRTFIDYRGNLIVVEPPGITLTEGEIHPGSSLGPTRDGRIKPDIAAPGHVMITPWNLDYLAADITGNSGAGTAAGGMHSPGGGTSSASPVVAGVAALYLQKNPNATAAEVKAAILSCPKTDNYTTNLPNNTWGYGKVSAYNALTCNMIFGCTDPTAFNYNPNANVDDNTCQAIVYGCTNVFGCNYNPFANVDDGSCTCVGIEDKYKATAALVNYPNPFSKETVIHYKFDKPQFNSAEIVIEDILGETIQSYLLSDHEGHKRIFNTGISGGVYFYSLVVDGEVLRTNKLIISQ